MNEFYDALENCLQAMEGGQKLESVLERYPDLERKLRPLLETSVLARESRQTVISEAVKHRGRVRLLQRANELRKVKSGSYSGRMHLFPRLAIALSLVGVSVLTSTGIVSASSGTLPGDQLYPVKRTWEGLRLFFASNAEERDLLESQFEQERLDEIDGLLGKGITAPIQFKGLVTMQVDGRWQISGIPVSVPVSTNSPAIDIPDGAPVIVTGVTGNNGVVEAQNVQLLQSGGPLPPFGPSENVESNSNGEHDDGNAIPTPVIVVTPGSGVSGSQKLIQGQITYQFSGVVQSQQKDVWIINGQSVSMDQVGVVGGIKIGSVVKFDGFYDTDGRFVVTKIEIKSADNSNKPRNDTGGNGSGKSANGSDGKGGPGGGDDGNSDDGGDH
jgi:Domain of unknown function (DUF5667)